jgi:superfamily II DNA/RNA helicase
MAGLSDEFAKGFGEFKLLQGDKESALFPEQAFDTLIPRQEIIEAIYDMDFDAPSKVQCQAIPILTGPSHDSLVAQAPSGSGKTIAFLVSALLIADINIREPQVLCLAHTLEIVDQTRQVFVNLNRKLHFVGGTCVGHVVDLTPECQFIFGTPKAILSQVKRNALKVSALRIVVVDEADSILLPKAPLFTETKRLLDLIPRECQIGCVSPTFCPTAISIIEALRPNVKKLLQQEVCRSISHWVVQVGSEEEARAIICDLYRVTFEGQTIIFGGGKLESVALKDFLTSKGYRAELINGDLSKEQRRTVVQEFREEKFKVLIGTDAISRGLDIPQVFLVICLDVPRTYDSPRETVYQHRAGRSGRFGRNGVTFNIVKSPAELKALQDICDILKITLNVAKAGDLSSLPREEEIL